MNYEKAFKQWSGDVPLSQMYKEEFDAVTFTYNKGRLEVKDETWYCTVSGILVEVFSKTAWPKVYVKLSKEDSADLAHLRSCIVKGELNHRVLLQPSGWTWTVPPLIPFVKGVEIDRFTFEQAFFMAAKDLLIPGIFFIIKVNHIYLLSNFMFSKLMI
jgi:hypothetical protein